MGKRANGEHSIYQRKDAALQTPRSAAIIRQSSDPSARASDCKKKATSVQWVACWCWIAAGKPDCLRSHCEIPATLASRFLARSSLEAPIPAKTAQQRICGIANGWDLLHGDLPNPAAVNRGVPVNDDVARRAHAGRVDLGVRLNVLLVPITQLRGDFAELNDAALDRPRTVGEVMNDSRSVSATRLATPLAVSRMSLRNCSIVRSWLITEAPILYQHSHARGV